eukprot:7706963-Alexandrium_andersonii.AAC.1
MSTGKSPQLQTLDIDPTHQIGNTVTPDSIGPPRVDSDRWTPLDAASRGKQFMTPKQFCHLSLGATEGLLKHDDIPLAQ